MDLLKEIITTVILSIVGTIITVAGGYLTSFLKSKINNEKLKDILVEADKTVSDGVRYVYQTYVESLKGTDLWNAEAMNEANQKALDYVRNRLPQDAQAYISSQGRNIEEWILEQIEIAINKAKHK